MDKKKPVSANKNKTIDTSLKKPVYEDARENNKSDKNQKKNSSFSKKTTRIQRSMIPRLQLDFHLKKGGQQSQIKMPLQCKKSTSEVSNKEYGAKLQNLEGNENTITEFYTKIEALVRQITERKSSDKLREKCAKRKIFVKNYLVRKMISDPTVFKKIKYTNNNNIFHEFESCVHEISDIWMKTSADVTHRLQNLSRETVNYTSDFESQKTKIQKAIRRARSFTLIKTRSVIAEAKKIMIENERIQKKHKNIGMVKSAGPPAEKQEIKIPTTLNDKINYYKQQENQFNLKPRGHIDLSVEAKKIVKDIDVNEILNEIIGKAGEHQREKTLFAKELNEIASCSDELTMSKDLATRLRRKVFDLQNIYNEYSLKCNHLQMRLVNFSKKFCWDQVLVKNVDKSSDVKHIPPKSENTFDSETKEINFEMKNLDEELGILVKTNYLLIQQKLLLDHQNQFINKSNREYVHSEEDCFKNLMQRFDTAKKILNEKQNAVDQLQKILTIMADQKISADKHKSLMEDKIRDLKKLQN